MTIPRIKTCVLRLLFLMLLPSSAMAIELDFYTFGGFQATVDAFKRIALIFNDDGFIGIFYVFAVLGLAVGYAIHSGNQMLSAVDGQGKPSLRVIFTVAIGIGIFQGTVISKGEITVYDEQLNQFETVKNVPDILVIAAGFTNLAERAVTDIVDNNGASPLKDYAGGVNYKLIYDAASKTTSFKQFYAIKSLQKFYQECSLLPLNTNTTDFNLSTLKSGTKDIFSYLEELKSPSSYTLYYTSKNKEGSLLSCSDAYDALKLIFNTETAYVDYLNAVCEANGFDSSNILQFKRCKEIIGKTAQGLYGDTSLGYMSVMKNYLVGLAITDAIQQENPDIGTTALSNRAMMNDGIGTSVAANNWLPTIKSVVTSIILTITPILLLFVVTGLAWKVINIIFALFAWLAIWGVCDALLLKSIADQTYGAFAEVISHDMGLTAIMLTPGAAMKSLGIMGEARGMGITIASFIAVTLFRINAYAFSQIGQNFTNQINKHGEQGGQQVNNPEQNGQLSEQIVNGNGYLTSMSNAGYDSALTASMLNSTSQIMTGASVAGTLGGGPVNAGNRVASSNSLSTTTGVRSNEILSSNHGGIKPTAELLAAESAGRQSGNLQGLDSVPMPGATLFDKVEQTSRVEAEKRVGDSLGVQRAAESSGSTVLENTAQISEQSIVQARGNADNFEQVVSNVQLSNPDLTISDIAQNYSVIQNRDSQGRLIATNGNPALHAKQSQEQSLAELVRWDAYKNALEEQDLNFAQASWANGSIQGFADSGKLTAYAFSGGDMIAQAEHDLALRSAYKGETSYQNMLEQTYGNYDAFYTNLAEHSHLMEYAGAKNFMALADNIGIDPNELAIAMTGQQQLTLTGDQAAQLHENNILTDSQYASLKNGGGWSISQSLGSILSSSSQSGQSASIDNSSTNDNSSSYKSGLQLPHDQDVRSYITEQPFRADFVEDVSEIIAGNTSLKDTLIQRSADSLAPVVRTDRTLSEGITGDFSASASKSTPTGLPFSAGALIRGGISGRDVETDTYSSHRAIMERSLDSIIEASENKVSMLISNGTTAKEAEAIQSQFVAEKYADIYTDYFTYLKDKAQGKLSRVDMNDRMEDIFEYHNLNYTDKPIDTTPEKEHRANMMKRLSNMGI